MVDLPASFLIKSVFSDSTHDWWRPARVIPYASPLRRPAEPI
jgi:hypothetical protein